MKYSRFSFKYKGLRYVCKYSYYWSPLPGSSCYVVELLYDNIWLGCFNVPDIFGEGANLKCEIKRLAKKELDNISEY